MAQPTKPGNAERGWNDPPMFLHVDPAGSTSLESPPAQKRSLLNRRVFHPGIMGSPEVTPSGGSSAPPPGGGLINRPPMDGPPMGGSKVVLLPPAPSAAVPNFPAPMIIPNLDTTASQASPPPTPPICEGDPTKAPPVDDIEIPDFMDDSQLFHYTASRLRKVLIHCKTALNSRGYDEVSRKLDVFEKMWEDGKLSYPVKATMAKLAIALHAGKCELANHLHLGLMMDYVSEVGQWMVGIKRLIQEAEGPFSPVGSPTKPCCALEAHTTPLPPAVAEQPPVTNCDNQVPDSSQTDSVDDCGTQDGEAAGPATESSSCSQEPDSCSQEPDSCSQEPDS